MTTMDLHRERTFRISLITKIAVLILFILLIVSGIWFYLFDERTLRQQIVNELTSIAELKTSQIVDWNNEWMTDITVFSRNPFFITKILQWENEKNDQALDELNSLGGWESQRWLHDSSPSSV